MTIYIDEFIIINTILNYTVLYITKKIIKAENSRLRLLIFSITSSLISLLLLIFNPGFFTNALIKFLFSILLVFFTFTNNNLKNLFKRIIVFYFVNFTIGGCGYALYNILTSTPDYSLIKLLLITIGISYIGINTVVSLYKSYYKYDSLTHKLTIKYDNKVIETNCFYDTGNNLHDPITKLPVIIADITILKKILPEKTTKLFKETNNTLKLYQALHTEMNLKLIPYHTVSENSFMVGFIPSFISIDDISVKAVIGIISMKNNKTRAILNPDIINKET